MGLFLATMLAAQTATAALPPAGKWIADFAEDRCTLSRRFGAGSTDLLFGLRPLPGDAGGDVLLVSPRRGWNVKAGEGHILIRPSGERFPMRWTSGPVSNGPGRATQMLIDRPFWKALGSAETLEISAGERPVTLSTGVMTRALTTLRTCQDDLLRRWGADPSVPLVEMPDDVVQWFGANDYPLSSIKEGEQGRVVILASLDRTGKPTACRTVRSSGFSRLDDLTCTLVMSKGRFDPGAADGPAIRWSVLAVRWTIPG